MVKKDSNNLDSRKKKKLAKVVDVYAIKSLYHYILL
jgi:hypothetical protein